MRNVVAALIVSLALAASAFAESRPSRALRWDPWQRLPVLDAGRHKPLETLARETLRSLCGRESSTDPETGRKLTPTALYLEMLFDRQGSLQASDPHALAGVAAHGAHLSVRQPDKWDRADLLRVDAAPLREALGMAQGDRYLSPLELRQATVRAPDTSTPTPFLAWTRKLFRSKQQGFTKLEQQALELADKLLSYRAHRTGNRLYVLPVQGSEHEDWLALGTLLQSSLDDQTDPTGELRKAKAAFESARKAYVDGSAEGFQDASESFVATVEGLGPQLGNYPRNAVIRLELAYNRWAPFRLAWVFSFVAFLCLLASTLTRRKALAASGLAVLVAGLLVMLLGFAARMIISGRAPVTNLYESVVFMGFGAILLGLVFGVVYRRIYMLTAAAAVAAMTLLLADRCPTVLDPAIRPLQPVLRSNFWLAVHVITIMLSYAAFALALAVGNVTLGYYLVGSTRREAIRAQARFTYQSLQAGVLLLSVGTILGAMWADYSWGRFWGWDPKEVWALITLTGYLAVLHARRAGWIGDRGLAAWSVLSFAMVVMAWYGVNLLGTGLHNYGLGGDGAEYVILGTALAQLLYVTLAVTRAVDSKSRLVPAPVGARRD